MNAFLEELFGGMPDWTQFERVVIRLLAAMPLGACPSPISLREIAA